MGYKQILLFASALVVFAAGIVFSFVLKNRNQQIPSIYQTAQASPTPNPIEKTISQMSLEEKIGALFLIGFNGAKLDEETIRFFQKHHFNAFLLMKKNIVDQEQLIELTNFIIQLNLLPFPSIIAVDQEGGSVNRIEFEEIGKIDISQRDIKTEEQAYRVAKKRGEVLASLGVNLNFSPVLEVVSNESSFIIDRAFQGDEQKVASLANQMVKGYHDSEIVSAIKHFPGGLGRTRTDPHKRLPVLEIGQDELAKDIFPFKELIKIDDVEAIMATHILYPQIDKKNPSSLSDEFISGILKHDFGFDGVVISDDLVMKAISSKFSIAQAAKLAFIAGIDLLVISSDSSDQQEAYKTLLQAVEDEEISVERVDESVKRILELRRGLSN